MDVGIEDPSREASPKQDRQQDSNELAAHIDMDELIEIRARQRTFEGAYARSALANLGYSLTILRLFDRRFFKIGVLYAAMAMLLLVCAYLRAHFVDHKHHTNEIELGQEGLHTSCPRAIRTRGHEGKRIIGPPFVSAGRIVILVALIVAITEAILAVLVFQL